ncbi:MAG: hypothetical protein AAGH64_09200 [Planctomycetota bacterium]
MPFRRPSRAELAGVRARREHSEWLTSAMHGYHVGLPSIPTAKYDPANGHHGYSKFVKTPRGRQWCDAWWKRAFSAISLGEPGGRLRFMRRF